MPDLFHLLSVLAHTRSKIVKCNLHLYCLQYIHAGTHTRTHELCIASIQRYMNKMAWEYHYSLTALPFPVSPFVPLVILEYYKKNN